MFLSFVAGFIGISFLQYVGILNNFGIIAVAILWSSCVIAYQLSKLTDELKRQIWNVKDTIWDLKIEIRNLKKDNDDNDNDDNE